MSFGELRGVSFEADFNPSGPLLGHNCVGVLRRYPTVAERYLLLQLARDNVPAFFHYLNTL